MRQVFFFVMALMVSLPASADWASDFEQLKNHPRSYEDSGAICEEIARLDLEREYEMHFPDAQIEVLNGIGYADENGTLGELDVVVFKTDVETNQKNVVQIAEVKCWKDINGGLEKAREQRARFVKALRSSKELKFYSTSSAMHFERTAFSASVQFITIGQKGAGANGYDRELQYELLELHRFRNEMVRCQFHGQCARP
ncbi:MAG: hypothetical protein IPJ84_18715 [Bdellovibrionales bacterium]|nr:hypothetical protein [Bdellovibrionales bacterium]